MVSRWKPNRTNSSAKAKAIYIISTISFCSDFCRAQLGHYSTYSLDHSKIFNFLKLIRGKFGRLSMKMITDGAGMHATPGHKFTQYICKPQPRDTSLTIVV